MGLLSFSLKVQRAELGPVEEGDVDPRTIDSEAIKKPVCIRRRAVCGAPKGESIIERHWLETILIEDVHVAWPTLGRIQGVRAKPIVVTGGEVDATRRQAPKHVAQECRRIRSKQIVFVEVSSTEQGVSILIHDQQSNPLQHTTLCISTLASNVSGNAHPGERHVEVQVGEVNDLHVGFSAVAS